MLMVFVDGVMYGNVSFHPFVALVRCVSIPRRSGSFINSRLVELGAIVPPSPATIRALYGLSAAVNASLLLVT